VFSSNAIPDPAAESIGGSNINNNTAVMIVPFANGLHGNPNKRTRFPLIISPPFPSICCMFVSFTVSQRGPRAQKSHDKPEGIHPPQAFVAHTILKDCSVADCCHAG
jgi:hypothetical protein